jgi:hypothetical protein
MPFKNPERKRQWEQEHREQRNERRRRHHLTPQIWPVISKPVRDPISAQDARSGLMIVAGIVAVVLMIRIALVATWGGVGLQTSDPLAPSPGPSD